MGDRLPRPVNAFTASAKVLNATVVDAPKAESWHDEAWSYRDTTGELRFAELWLANSLSRVRLLAARRPEPGAEPMPIESGPAADMVAELAGGPGGQSALLRGFAAHLLTPGVGYLVGEPTKQGANRWAVYSAEQIRLSTRTSTDGQRTYDIMDGPNPEDWRQLPPGSLPVKVWRPHPRYSWQPDSPVRAALPILRELSLLTQHVEATATSRLAGSGILAMDSSIQFAETWEKWVDELLDTITKPIKNRNLASAVAPFPMRLSVPKGQKIADLIAHIRFSTPFDEQSLKLRDEAIDRLATAMDMPKRQLTGEQENHWGKWATTEEGITLHVQPNMELICDGITRGYLDPAMALVNTRPAGQVFSRGTSGRVLEVRPLAAPPGDAIVWYDTSQLQVRPDRSQDTKDAYDRWEATGDDLRRETGISDATSPEGSDFERRVWLQLLTSTDPEIQRQAIRKLGLDIEDPPVPPAPVVVNTPNGQQPALPAPDDEQPQALPDTNEAPPPSQAPAAAGLVPAAALVAACDGLVYRALEKAGNRLRQAVRRSPMAADCAAPLMHTCLNATAVRPMVQLLDGAWDRVPEVADMLGEPPDLLANTLDAYTRVLIRTGQAHTWEALACALGCADELGCGKQVPA